MNLHELRNKIERLEPGERLYLNPDEVRGLELLRVFPDPGKLHRLVLLNFQKMRKSPARVFIPGFKIWPGNPQFIEINRSYASMKVAFR